jgi:hypothetical protein
MLDDWLERLTQAGVDIGRDFSPADETLDNLVVYEGQLYWCDGDIIYAGDRRPEEMHAVVDDHRANLEPFVGRSA